MAVYTPVSLIEARQFWRRFGLGDVVQITGITSGVENSNFLLETDASEASAPTAAQPPHQLRKRYILTLFERRTNAADLPYFLGLMQHLANKGLPCPNVLASRDGTQLHSLNGKPAIVISFLSGSPVEAYTSAHMHALGNMLATMHSHTRDFTLKRTNTMGAHTWAPLYERCTDKLASLAGAQAPALASFSDSEHALIGQTLSRIAAHWPEDKDGVMPDMPYGTVHADLFPDNVFFSTQSKAGNTALEAGIQREAHTQAEAGPRVDANTPRISGVIDFYFAAHDALAYDLAVTLNAWCFAPDGHYQPSLGKALIRSYIDTRASADMPFSTAEHAAFPLLCEGAALRFLLSRLYDALYPSEGAQVVLKDPRDYLHRLQFHQTCKTMEDYLNA